MREKPGCCCFWWETCSSLRDTDVDAKMRLLDATPDYSGRVSQGSRRGEKIGFADETDVGVTETEGVTRDRNVENREWLGERHARLRDSVGARTVMVQFWWMRVGKGRLVGTPGIRLIRIQSRPRV